ncbi:hypothetical protein KIPB_017264, partial [Kipferlia bialata]
VIKRVQDINVLAKYVGIHDNQQLAVDVKDTIARWKKDGIPDKFDGEFFGSPINTTT